MIFGILITTDEYRDDIIGLTEASIKRGHRVILFFMDQGCKLATDKRIAALCSMDNVQMSLCDLNRRRIGLLDKDIPESITCGSQYDNAVMNKESDKVIVL